MSNIRCLFIGDVVGKAGMAVVESNLPGLVEKYRADAVIVNGENSANNGKGISPRQVNRFKNMNVAVITSGNHIWNQRDMMPHFNELADYVLRPANYPSICPGKGYTIIDVAGVPVAVVNLQGRVFMHQHVDCPMKTMESLLLLLKQKAKVIFVDFHAETTSEKEAMGFYLDGKVSAVVGTHTHVQTADHRILPHGTAYITDLGCSAALNSALGVKKEIIIQKMLTQMPIKFEVELEGPYVLSGLCVEVDTLTGKAVSVEPIRVVDNDCHEMVEKKK